MPRFEETIAVNVSRLAVWRLISDVTQWPTWLPTVSSVTALDGAVLRTGARYRIVQPRLRPGIWVVTASEAPRGFTWEMRAPGLRVVADHLVEDDATAGSRVTLRLDMRGLLSVLVALLTGSLTRKYLAQEAAAVKKTAEARVHLAMASEGKEGRGAS